MTIVQAGGTEQQIENTDLTFGCQRHAFEKLHFIPHQINLPGTALCSQIVGQPVISPFQATKSFVHAYGKLEGTTGYWATEAET